MKTLQKGVLIVKATNIHFTETWVCVHTKVQLGTDSQSLAVAYSELFVAGIFN